MAITKAKKKYVGDFKHKVTLKYSEKTADGMGGFTTEEKTLSEEWVMIKPISGKQRLHLESIDSTVTHTVEMRHRDLDLTHENWIEYGDRVFNLHYVINQDEECYYYEFAASEET